MRYHCWLSGVLCPARVTLAGSRSSLQTCEPHVCAEKSSSVLSGHTELPQHRASTPGPQPLAGAEWWLRPFEGLSSPRDKKATQAFFTRLQEPSGSEELTTHASANSPRHRWRRRGLERNVARDGSGGKVTPKPGANPARWPSNRASFSSSVVLPAASPRPPHKATVLIFRGRCDKTRWL